MLNFDALVRRWMVAAFACAVLACALAGADPSRTQIHDDFSRGMGQWLPPQAADWQIGTENGNPFLRLAKAGYPPGIPRRPLNYALLRNSCVSDFRLSTRLRRAQKSLMIVFDYQDTLHFNYVHLSADRGTEQPVHNGIFRVDDGPRVRIDDPNRPAALPDQNWHTVKIVRQANRVDVYMDGAAQPLLSVDHGLFAYGRVGIGSFDETGDYDDWDLDGAADHGCDRVMTKLPAMRGTSTDGTIGFVEFPGIRQWKEYSVETAELYRRADQGWQPVAVSKSDIEAMIAGTLPGIPATLVGSWSGTDERQGENAPYLKLSLRKK